MVVASGSGQNRHAYWFLEKPVDLERLEGMNRRLALALGADVRSSDRARILRPAGSLNRKHSPAEPVRLLGLEERGRVSVAELECRLPREDSTRPVPRRTRCLRPAASRDPLQAVPPTHCCWARTIATTSPSTKIVFGASSILVC